MIFLLSIVAVVSHGLGSFLCPAIEQIISLDDSEVLTCISKL